MNLEDRNFVESLNCYENDYDVLVATSKDLSNIQETIGVLRDKVIELLTPKEIMVNPSISVTSSNEYSFQINEALHKLADTRRLVVQRDSKGKRLREGLFNDDCTVEWTRKYS